jgi:flavin reductase (DIM6/NTAB) family NADH-FMN oxidoreductase RutF
VPPDRLEAAHLSGGEYAPHVSEAALLGLELLPSERVAPPRLACAEVALECRLHREIPVGTPAAALCLLEVVWAHVADRVAAAGGLPDPLTLRAPARLGGDGYLTAEGWTVVEIPRIPPPEHLRLPRR